MRGIRNVYVLSNMYNSVCDTGDTVSFDRVRCWGKSLVSQQWRGRPLMGPKLISRNCGYTGNVRLVRPGYPFYPNRNKISPYAGRVRVRERARVLHNIIALANGGNKQTRLSYVHTVTLAGFRLRRRRYKGFAKLHVAELRRNFNLMGHAREEGPYYFA